MCNYSADQIVVSLSLSLSAHTRQPSKYPPSLASRNIEKRQSRLSGFVRIITSHVVSFGHAFSPNLPILTDIIAFIAYIHDDENSHPTSPQAGLVEDGTRGCEHVCLSSNIRARSRSRIRRLPLQV